MTAEPELAHWVCPKCLDGNHDRCNHGQENLFGSIVSCMCSCHEAPALEVDLSEYIQSLTPLDNGYRIIQTDDYVIEVHKMLTNWRLIVAPPNQRMFISHGFCYFGRGPDPFIRAVAAGRIWADPLNTEPIGFDKKAF